MVADQWDHRVGKELRRQHQQQYAAANAKCWLCGQPIDYTRPAHHPDALDIDHVHPRSTHPELSLDPANLRPSHVSCNRSKREGLPAPALGSLSEAW